MHQCHQKGHVLKTTVRTQSSLNKSWGRATLETTEQYHIHQGWNWVKDIDLDDPVTHKVLTQWPGTWPKCNLDF